MPLPLLRLLGDTADRDRTAVTREVDAVVGRLATLFTTFKEFPAVRWGAAQNICASVVRVSWGGRRAVSGGEVGGRGRSRAAEGRCGAVQLSVILASGKPLGQCGY